MVERVAEFEAWGLLRTFRRAQQVVAKDFVPAAVGLQKLSVE